MQIFVVVGIGDNNVAVNIPFSIEVVARDHDHARKKVARYLADKYGLRDIAFLATYLRLFSINERI
jgi:hypothetical protein